MFGKRKDEGQKGDTQFFVVYDSKTGIYDLPNPAQNKEDMIRAILNLFRSPQGREHRYFQNAEDFSLFFVGYFDKKTGEIYAESPKHCVNFHELKFLVTSDAPSPMVINGVSSSQTEATT